jgi:hypothetical protein
MDWYILKATAGFTAPVLSVTFLVMGVVRYFLCEIADRRRSLARAAFMAYAMCWLLMALFVVLARVSVSAGSAIFLIGAPMAALLAAVVSTFLGFLSRLASGRRVAIAGMLILVAILLGLLNSLGFGNIVS